MPQAADYKLSDLLGIAGATVALIIAGAILLQCFITKYMGIIGNYRGLTGEYRANHASDPRRHSLQHQIDNYRRQLVLLNFSSTFTTLALLLFLVTVGVASLSVAFPKELTLRLIGTIALFAALGLLAAAVFLELVENILSRRDIRKEVADFDDLTAPGQRATNREQGAAPQGAGTRH